MENQIKVADSSCVRCLYNSGNFPGLSFDRNGVCSSCQEYQRQRDFRLESRLGYQKLGDLLWNFSRKSSNSDFDCIVGVSGGVDSSYLLKLAHSFGLRILAVHFDNGWNSDLSVTNIDALTDALNVQLETFVVDWEEFRSLQIAFLNASTPDVEVCTDHAIQAVLLQTAKKFGIKLILSGMNFQTESPTAPKHWTYGQLDWKYINSVNELFGKLTLKKYPHFTIRELLTRGLINGVKIVSPLNYIDYSKKLAESEITKLGWVAYSGKHHESTFTKYFQGSFLPAKFSIDKRIAHLSDLIRCGEISRDEAINILSQPPIAQREAEKLENYVLKKLEIDPSTFETIMKLPIRSYSDYSNNEILIRQLKNGIYRGRKFGLIPK